MSKPMALKRLSVGVVHEGATFDLRESTEQIEKKNKK
jgi:hypothetical protein